MNLISRTVTGIVLIVIGAVLVGVSPFIQFISLIYGIPVLIVGIFILLNKKEDQIEPIKKSKNLNK